MKVLAVVLVPDYMPERALIDHVKESAKLELIRLATNEDIANILIGHEDYYKVEG